MKSTTVRCLISGRVQGVWFRDSTRHVAESLGIRGSAVNLPDGRVEVIAHGNEVQLSELKKWLATGPTLARVDQVQCQPIDGQPDEGFFIG